MSLTPGCWLEIKFKPTNTAARRIETLAHEAISVRVREVLIRSNIAFQVRSRLEDEIEWASRRRRNADHQ